MTTTGAETYCANCRDDEGNKRRIYYSQPRWLHVDTRYTNCNDSVAFGTSATPERTS